MHAHRFVFATWRKVVLHPISLLKCEFLPEHANYTQYILPDLGYEIIDFFETKKNVPNCFETENTNAARRVAFLPGLGVAWEQC